MRNRSMSKEVVKVLVSQEFGVYMANVLDYHVAARAKNMNDLRDGIYDKLAFYVLKDLEVGYRILDPAPKWMWDRWKWSKYPVEIPRRKIKDTSLPTLDARMS